MGWAQPKENREQLVLFAEKLDDAVPIEHPVRTIDAMLGKIDWSNWEASYDLTKGQPPIHPRVIAGVILYGLLKRVRTSRALEEALQFRLDFRWLAEGRSIDHSTIARFRTSNAGAIGDLFVQIGLIAQQMGHLTLRSLGYDGTRLRASNRRSGTRTPDELRQAKKQLTAEFEEHRQAVEQAQDSEDEIFDAAAAADKEEQLSRQSQQIDSALAELERIQSEGKKVPDRLPITDPQSRIAKNKEGGFAPNYTPTATVDADSGLIAAADVISGIDEQSHMHGAIDQVRESFMEGDREGEVQVLADGLMATGENIAACKDKHVDFYTPAGPENPAYRKDPSQPIAAEKIDRLPVRGKKPKKGEQDERTFDKSAFLYDAEADVYYCPMGKTLERKSRRKDHTGAERFLYRADKRDCSGCSLRTKCFKNSRNQYGGRIECGVHEQAKTSHTRRMQRDCSRTKYALRAAVTERPFALIKHHFGVREFLVRGLEKVRCEWQWLCIAHNVHRLLCLAPHLARACVP
ncbi:Transposase DDE domain protein [Rosistilla ulvae]|uniref:Transposase DDE domain protein n=1 Tax=Rosistilla ulvae TaxID=1930277 RepID=A0A517M504_9BACT|nr:IS1182 family transposase [Rosistilla ulvae]QDS89949.1 Transposase DDE domain protein [Rosistilla ulvae]